MRADRAAHEDCESRRCKESRAGRTLYNTTNGCQHRQQASRWLGGEGGGGSRTARAVLLYVARVAYADVPEGGRCTTSVM